MGHEEEPGGGEQRALIDASSFSARDVVTSALRAFARNWQSMLVLAVVVFGTTTVAEGLVHTYSPSRSDWVKVLIDLPANVLGLLGTVFYAGVLGGVVGSSEHGRSEHTALETLRILPFKRLIIADLTVSLVAAIGLIFAIVPGLVIFSLLSLTGPLIKIEGETVRGALGRSRRLARRRFWLVSALVTVPVFVGSAVLSSAVDASGFSGLGAFIVTAVIDDAFGIVSALFAVEITFRFLELPNGAEAPTS